MRGQLRDRPPRIADPSPQPAGRAGWGFLLAIVVSLLLSPLPFPQGVAPSTRAPHTSGTPIAPELRGVASLPSAQEVRAPQHPVALSATPVALVHPNGVSFGLQMEGIDASNCGCTPPDVQVASGPTDVVEFVNLAGEVFNTSTGSAVTSFSLPRFFGTGSDFLSDPRILYDNGSGRWYASIFDYGTAGNTMLAVSYSSNPTGSWHVYAIPTPSGTFGDQPILGLSSTLIGLGVTLYSASTSAFAGGMYWVVNKSAAMSGTLTYRGFGPDFGAGSYHPVDAISPTRTLYMVTTISGSASNAVALFNISGVPPGNVTVQETNVSITSFAAAPAAQQAGSSVVLDTGDQRVLTSVWRNGILWLGFDDSCLPAGTSRGNRACIRVVEINTTTGGVLQDFDYGIANADVYYPAFALDPSGDLTVVFGESSGSLYPSIEVTGRFVGDPNGTLLPPAALIEGSSPMSCGYSGCRYGDYFGASASIGAPGTWVAGEYVTSRTEWQTRVGHVQITSVSPRLSVNPTEVDPSRTVTVTLALTNSPCTALGKLYCSVHLPLPGRSYTSGCTNPFVETNVTLIVPTPGRYLLGTGGYVDAYSSSTCSPGSLLLNLSLTPVALTVVPGPTATLSVLPSAYLEVGETSTFAANVTGGVAPYTAQWSTLPAGCASVAALQLTCSPSSPGTVVTNVSVTDADAVVASATVLVTVLPAPSVTVSILPAEIELGQSAAIVATVAGGLGSLTYAWANLPPGCPGENVSFLTCAPTAIGTYSVSVNVTDSIGFTATNPGIQLRVVAPPSVGVAASPGTVVRGQSETLTATAHAGVAPFTYRWTGLPAGCSPANRSTITCSPSSAGTFTVTVVIVDAVGGTATSTATVTVAPPSVLGLSDTSLLLIGVVAFVALVGGISAVLISRRRRRPELRSSGAPKPPG